MALLSVPAAAVTAPATLKLASWNLEWLMTPQTFGELKGHCTSNGGERRFALRSMPCDVAGKLQRSASDFAALARYANALNADVVAVQEVDGAATARLVFRDHDFCFSGARALQNNGFAIRHGIPHRCEPDYLALSLNDSVRRGAVVTLFPGTRHEMLLMSVHLKSGCARAELSSHNSACQKLARQVEPLQRWIAARSKASERFGVLGDFNRELTHDTGPARDAAGNALELWPAINDGEPFNGELLNAGATARFANCATGQRHSAYIDQIVLGRRLAQWLVLNSFERLTWQAGDAARLTLSDHCPIAIRLQLPRGN